MYIGIYRSLLSLAGFASCERAAGMNERATACPAVPDITPTATGQRKDTTGNSGAIPNGLNWQSMEFTDLACYKRLEAQEDELTAGLNRAQQRHYLSYVLSTHEFLVLF